MEDPSAWEEELRSLPQYDSSQAPDDTLEEFEDVPEFDEFDLDEDSAWVDAYIASLPLDSMEAQLSGSSSSSSQQVHSEAEHQQMDVMMG